MTPSEKGIIRATFGCDEKLGEIIAKMSRIRVSDALAQLHPRGDENDIGLLIVGRAREVAYGRGGDWLLLHELASGDLFGALFENDNDHQSSRVEAITRTRAAHFAPVALVRLMETYAVIALAVARQLSRRLERMRARMTETVLLTATGRVCSELAKRAAGTADRVIRPMPVLAEIAVIAQTTRETTSRTLSMLEKRGIVRRVPGGLELVAAHRLEEMIY